MSEWMSDDWRADDLSAELWQLINDVCLIEEIPVARIVDMCDEHQLDAYKFVSSWEKCVDQCHALVTKIEEKMP